MIVCNCFGISDKEIRELIENGAGSVEEIAEVCYATMGCGMCKQDIEEILNPTAENADEN